MKGKVKHWNFERGFGWFLAENGRDYFCHITHWNEPSAPEVGREIEFELGPSRNGKPDQVINGRYAGGADASN